MTYKEHYTELIREIKNSDIPFKEEYIKHYTQKIKDINWKS